MGDETELSLGSGGALGSQIMQGLTSRDKDQVLLCEMGTSIVRGVQEMLRFGWKRVVVNTVSAVRSGLIFLIYKQASNSLLPFVRK